MGKLYIQGDGLVFKSSSHSAKPFQVKHSEIDTVEWMKVARGYGVKLMTREGKMIKFDGFKDSVSDKQCLCGK